MKSSPFPVAILAGGLATRLHPLTVTIPKSLILINQEPFISHQLRLLRKNNIKKVVICIGHLGEQIEDYIGNGDEFDLDVTYSYDGPQLLGTAGAIKKAIPLLGENFYILYGDSYLPCDYLAAQEHFTNSDKSSLMSIYKNQGLWDKSNVEYDNKQIITYDKINRNANMQHIDYGLGIFNQSAFDNVPENTMFDLADLYQQLISQKNLAAYEVDKRFYEIGSLSGIKELEQYLISFENA